jgi:hypothetical protein
LTVENDPLTRIIPFDWAATAKTNASGLWVK